MVKPRAREQALAPRHHPASEYPNVLEMAADLAADAETAPATALRAVFMQELIRAVEAWLLAHADLVHGPIHSSIGQEAVAVGAALALEPGDFMTATHRAHHHVLAKQVAYHLPADFDPIGMEPPAVVADAVRRTIAEVMGLAAGLAGGRGGSMHLADFEAGIATTAIVAGGAPIATGAGLAARLRDQPTVAVAALGDGAVSIGAFHEGASLARAWRLPVIFLVENNRYSVATGVDETFGFDEPVLRAAGYDMPAIVADGMDPLTVMRAMQTARGIAASDGPVLLEARTYRYYHHSGPLPGSSFRYRTKEEEMAWAERDPLLTVPRRLAESGLASLAEIELVSARARALAEASFAALTHSVDGALQVRGRAYPPVRTAALGMVGPGLPRIRPALLDDRPSAADPVTYGTAVSNTIARWLKRDPDAFVMGIEVGHLGGGAFGATRASLTARPNRVLSTPICENGFVGAGLGAALQGMHPIVELMYPDFALEAADQLFNHVAKARYMYGGHHEVPIVVRTQTARGRGYGPQHSCDPAALFALFPGWRIAAPSTPGDYIGLFNAAMLSRDPTLIVEDHRLAKMTGAVPRAGEDFVIPFQSARRVREGDDVTVLAWSWALTRVLVAAERLSRRGISVDVLDPRWLDVHGLDRAAILDSVRRTGALVIVEDAMRAHSMGSFLLDALLPDLHGLTRVAPVRVTGADAFAPVSRPLEQSVLLRDREIEGAIVSLAAGTGRKAR